jgi:hypothetical protein
MDKPRIVREAVQRYGDLEEARESFKQEAEASWRNFKRPACI